MNEREEFEAAMRSIGWPERLFADGLSGNDRDLRDAAYTGWSAARASRPQHTGGVEPPSLAASNPHPGGSAAYLATEHWNEGWNACRAAMLAAPPEPAVQRPTHPVHPAGVQGGEPEAADVALKAFAEFVDKELDGRAPIWLWLARFQTSRVALSLPSQSDPTGETQR